MCNVSTKYRKVLLLSHGHYLSQHVLFRLNIFRDDL